MVTSKIFIVFLFIKFAIILSCFRTLFNLIYNKCFDNIPISRDTLKNNCRFLKLMSQFKKYSGLKFLIWSVLF